MPIQTLRERPGASGPDPDAYEFVTEARSGFAMVRTAAIAYAISQLRNHRELKGLEQPLSVLWKRCTLVAATCRAIAPRISEVNPDAAMLAGLLHGIGELYILTRAKRHEVLFRNDAAYRRVVRDWQASVGRIDLTDVLAVGYLLAAYQEHPGSLETNMSNSAIGRRLGLTRNDYDKLISESRDEMNALRDALDS